MENPYSPSGAKPLSEAHPQWRSWHTAINLILILISALLCLSQLAKVITEFGLMRDGLISFLFYLFRIIFFFLMAACTTFLTAHSRYSQWSFVILALAMVVSAYTVKLAGLIAIAYAVSGIIFSRYAVRNGLFR